MLRLTVVTILISSGLCHLTAQWSGGNPVRLNNSNRANRVAIDDIPGSGFLTGSIGKLYVLADPNSNNGGYVSYMQGTDMGSSDHVLQLGARINSGNPILLAGEVLPSGALAGGGEDRFQIFSSGTMSLAGRLSLLEYGNPNGGNTAIRVKGSEALWYDGSVYSWGFGGTRNRFADPITIGAGVPATNTGLLIDEDKDLDIFGSGDLNFQSSFGNMITFKNQNAFTKSSIHSGQNFLGISDATQLFFDVGNIRMLTLTTLGNHALFDTDVSIGDDHQLNWGSNPVDPNAELKYEFIGPNSEFGSMTLANNSVQGPLTISSKEGEIQINNGNASVNLDNGFVGINEKNPMHALHVDGDVGITGEFYALSDLRVKDQIEDIKGASEILSGLRPVTYQYKPTAYPTLTLSPDLQYGLIAQEVAATIPALTTMHSEVKGIDGVSTTLMGVNYTSIIPILIKGYQEQQVELDTYKSALEVLMQKVADLEERLEEK